MNKARGILLLTAVVAAMPLASRVLMHPAVTYANSTHIDIERIELSDTATVIHFSAHYRPGWWVTISHLSAIEVDGRMYPLRRSEGVGVDDRIVFPPSGRSEFTLYFDAIPASATKLNYYEGPKNSYGGFHLYDVDLTGTADMQRIPADVPDTLLRRNLDVPCPPAVFADDSTVIKVHMLDWNPGLMDHVILTYESAGSYYVALDSAGRGECAFKPYFTTRVDVAAGRHVYFGSFLTAPGDSVMLYLDAKAGADFLHGDIVPPRRLYADGMYRDYNYMYDTDNTVDELYVKHFAPVFADYRQSSDSYTRRIIDARRDALAELEAMNSPRLVSEAGRARLDYELLLSALRHRDLCALEYENSHLGFQIPEDSIVPHLDSRHYADAGAIADAGDPRYLLFGAWSADFYNGTFDSPVYSDLSLFARQIKRAGQLRLTEAGIDSLRACGNPYFATICETIGRSVAGRIADGHKPRIEPVPDVPPEDIVEAIAALYPGKTVVFNFWSGYGGPVFRRASSLVDDDDLILINIADTSTSLPVFYDVSRHYDSPSYYIDESQALALWKRYRIDSLPFFIVAGRDGKREYGPHLRNLQLLKEIVNGYLCE